MTDTAYERRLAWAARLLRDVTETLGMDPGTAWWRKHRAAIKQDLDAVQRAWDVERAQLRKVREEAGDGE